MGNDDIFDESDDDKTIKKVIEEREKTIEKVQEKQSNGSKRKYGILGATIIVGLIIGGSAYGIQTGIIAEIIGESEPFDSSTCNFGFHQDFFGNRCITLEEFEAIQERREEKPAIQEKPEVGGSGGGGTKDVSSASDKVELEKTKDMIGHYMITSNDDWYGDFVDIRKVPSKIEESGNMKISFRCFKDDFAGTSTYFGTFRNVIENDLTVDVYINGLEVESKSTTTNKALILEGSCYGHES